MAFNTSSRYARTSFAGLPSGAAITLHLGDFNIPIPISQFSMTYGVNAIPTASANIALGRNARTGIRSNIELVAPNLKQMLKARVTINGELGDWSPDGGGTKGGKNQYKEANDTVIFLGYLSGSAYRRTQGSITLALSFVGKLFDLSLSSSGSKDVLPGSPASLMLPTMVKGTGAKSSGTAAGRFTDELAKDMNTDFSNGLIKVLAFLANESQIQVHGSRPGEGVGGWCEGVTPPGDLSAPDSNKAVLQLFSGSGYWEGMANFNGLPDAQIAAGPTLAGITEPYPFSTSVDKGQVANYVGQVLSTTMSESSMWDILIARLLPQFGMAVIPFATSAAIVPILPMSKSPNYRITPNEYADFSISAASTKPLYGVGVMGTYSTATLATSENKQCVGAYFIPKIQSGELTGEPSVREGMWMFVNAPGWLDDWTNFDPETRSGDPSVVGLLTKPSSDTTGSPSQPLPSRDPDADVDRINNAMEGYAKWIYCANALRDRSGSVTGKFRLDISPGTILEVAANGESDDINPGTDTLTESLIGFVSRVTTNIDAEAGSANTTLELTHLRTKSENDDTTSTDRFSMARHPFFAKHFKGGYLVDKFKEPQIN